MLISALPVFLAVGVACIFSTNIWVYIALRALISFVGVIFCLTPVTLGKYYFHIFLYFKEILSLMATIFDRLN